MTIKEIETESGMTRANIRYYEAEGLLTPVRGKNGYREYSEEDLNTLMKIRLLRSLQFSLEEIKAFQTGKRELSEALEEQSARLQREKAQLEHSQEICRVMKNDGVCYQTLDAQRYLGALEQEDLQMVFQWDTAPQIRIPWRRYFARGMDVLFYMVVWEIFLALILGVNISIRSERRQIENSLVVVLMMLLFEPILLSLFGTTPGKWLLALRVTDNGGKRLTYGESLARTWKVFSQGMGFFIPIWSYYRLWMSYKACMAEETLEWEYDSAMILKDEKGWRTAAYMVAGILLVCADALAFRVSVLPKNRGDITIAEFCENYNRYLKFYGYESGYLNENGAWIQEENPNLYGYQAAYYLNGDGEWIQERNSIIGENRQPVFLFSETDGVMTGMSFSVEYKENNDWIYGYQQEMVLSILAFCGAQKENSIFSKELEKALSMVSEASGESFELDLYGIKVVCEVAYSGYVKVSDSGMMIPLEGVNGWYNLSFSMSRETNGY